MKVLIIDDERHCRVVIRKYLKSLALLVDEIEEAEDVASAVELVGYFEPDLVFLDIQLQDLTGFDFLDQVPERNFDVVFTTAYDEYAVKAFDYNAIHYMLKPIDMEAVQKAVKRYQDAQQITEDSKLQEAKFMYLKTEGKNFNVNLGKVVAVVADGSYSKVHNLDGTSIFSSKNLGEFEKQLPDNFFRAHKSVLINLEQVAVIDVKASEVVMSNDQRFPVSRRKKTALKEAVVAYNQASA